MPSEVSDSTPLIRHVWVREQQRMTCEELGELLGTPDDTALLRAVTQLRDAALLRPTRSNEEQDSDEEIAWDGSHLRRYVYSFRYVGVLQFGKRVLYILPKYCTGREGEDEETRLHRFRTILQVITRYRQQVRSMGEEDSEDEWHDYLHIMVELVMDFQTNGCYRVDEYINEMNGKGRILWAHTIRSVQPIMQDGRPYYTNLYTRRKREDSTYFITRLHRHLAWEAYRRLEKLRLPELLGLPVITDQTEHDEEFTDTDYLKQRLRQELTLRFDNRRRYLLGLMLRYLEEKDEETKDGLYMYGKTSFHQVWEEACRGALGMEASTTEQMLASIPHWEPFSEDSAQVLKADMFRYDKTHRTLLIVDAKYYTPQISSNRPNGMPGIGDIIKQQLYELALRHHFDAEAQTQNIFLMPLLDSERRAAGDAGIIRFGAVSIPMLTAGKKELPSPALRAFCGLQPIQLCKADPDQLWESYLNGSSLFENLCRQLKNAPQA